MQISLLYNLKKEKTETNGLTSATSNKKSPQVLTSTKVKKSKIDEYAEWDTIETIHAIRDAIATRHQVNLIEADEFAFEKLKSTKPDFVFNFAEGKNGASREAQMPAILEMLEIPYTGSDPVTLGICLDKSRTKEILSYYKIANPKFVVIKNLESDLPENLKYPLIIKPLFEGSSKGIFNKCFVKNEVELKKIAKQILKEYNQPALVEEFLPGREFTVAILGNGDRAMVLPIIEIKFDALPKDVVPIYSYEAKWIWDQAEFPHDIYECPAKTNNDLTKKIRKISLETFKVLGCRDWSRIDIRLDEMGEPNIIEINPIPGVLPKIEDNSCYPRAARMAGYNYNEMINAVLDEALLRNGLL